MKKIAMTTAICVLVFAALSLTSNAWAVCKPPQKLTDDAPAAPTKDCITDAQDGGTFSQLIADFFSIFR